MRFETAAGFAARIGVDPKTFSMWITRTRRGKPLPAPLPPPDQTDSAGRPLWNTATIDDWWTNHPRNKGTTT